MATVVIPIDFNDANALLNLPFPTLAVEYTNGGGSVANAFPYKTLTFNDSVLSAAFWQVPTAVVGAVTPATILYVDFYALTATTGNVAFGVQVGALGANTSLLTKALSSTVTAAVTAVSGTLNGRVRAAITLSAAAANVDNFATAVPTFFLKLYRDGTATTDTTAGDIKVTQLALSYSDT